MFAILSLVAFLIALILHLAKATPNYVTDAELAGFVFLAAHCVFGGGLLTVRRSQ